MSVKIGVKLLGGESPTEVDHHYFPSERFLQVEELQDNSKSKSHLI
jgi:hypothetical protein